MKAKKVTRYQRFKKTGYGRRIVGLCALVSLPVMVLWETGRFWFQELGPDAWSALHDSLRLLLNGKYPEEK